MYKISKHANENANASDHGKRLESCSGCYTFLTSVPTFPSDVLATLCTNVGPSKM